MIIYKDLINGDELFTDAFRVSEEGETVKFVTKLTTRKEGEIDDSLIGGNASAEEVQEKAEHCECSGLDFVLNGRLQQVELGGKKEFQKYFKSYFQKIEKKLFPQPEDSEEKIDYGDKLVKYRQRAKCFFDKVMQNMGDVDVYFGENDFEHGGTCCFVKWCEDGVSAEVYTFKDGLDCVKC